MMVENLYEFSDILLAVEAFICAAENIRFPVEAHWHYFVEIIYMTDGAITVNLATMFPTTWNRTTS